MRTVILSAGDAPNTLRPQETQAAHDMRLRVDTEHRAATEELANSALERYMSNNAMLAELFDGRPYQQPPGMKTAMLCMLPAIERASRALPTTPYRTAGPVVDALPSGSALGYTASYSTFGGTAFSIL